MWHPSLSPLLTEQALVKQCVGFPIDALKEDVDEPSY